MTPTITRTNPLSYLTEQLNDLKQKGTYFKLRVLEDEQAPVCTFDGKKVINLASNNYLGLTTHPKLREAALEATRKYGVGSGAVRTIAGTMIAVHSKTKGSSALRLQLKAMQQDTGFHAFPTYGSEPITPESPCVCRHVSTSPAPGQVPPACASLS